MGSEAPRVTAFDPKVGKLVFKGTSVPVGEVYRYVDCGDDEEYEIKRFLEQYPEVTREQLEAWLMSKEEQRLYAIEQGVYGMDSFAVLRNSGAEGALGQNTDISALIVLRSISLLTVACAFPIGAAFGLPVIGLGLLAASAAVAMWSHLAAKDRLAQSILCDPEFAACAERKQFLRSGGGDMPAGTAQTLGYVFAIAGLALVGSIVGLIILVLL